MSLERSLLSQQNKIKFTKLGNMTRDYQPEGVKYTFPDDDPYQESNEIYYNMVDFLDDSEVHQIWEIVGKALDRNNIVTTDNESLSVRVYDELSDED